MLTNLAALGTGTYIFYYMPSHMHMHTRHSKAHSYFLCACVCTEVNKLTVVSVQNDSNGAPAPLLVTVYLMTITLPVVCSFPTMIEETTRSGGGLRVTSMGCCRNDSRQEIVAPCKM